MSESETAEYDSCRKCGVALEPENIGHSIWLKPYCPACWPSECPNCGEPENYFWSVREDQLRCDNGCHKHGVIEI